MLEWFRELAAELSTHPVLQGVLAAFSTLILEDPTTVTCGLLVADGKMTMGTALLGVGTGIAIGDFALYGIGRFLGPRAIKWGIITRPQVDRAHAWFERNIVIAVLVSRFIPGMRMPTFIGAGILRASAWRFLLVVVLASFLWTWFLLHVSVRLGQEILPLFGKLKWPVMFLFVLGMIFFYKTMARRAVQAGERDREREAPCHSVFEFWPPWLFYIPVALYCLWLSVRYRGPLLPTASNPSIYASGFLGESKADILELAGAEARRWIAPWVRFERPRQRMDSEHLMGLVRDCLAGAGLEFPFVAKPDVGQRGCGVQRIDDSEALRHYVEHFPRGEKLLFQALARGREEAGIFYVRHPDEEKGQITSITLKEFPVLRGDDRRSVRELILDDPRASLLADIYFERHAEELDHIPSHEEIFPLVFSGNHCQGAIFRDGRDHITEAMTRRFDAIARDIPEFHFGRFDVRYAELEALRRGDNFEIIELNGAGAEETHIWDARIRLKDAYRTLFEQYRTAYRIGAANRARGFQPLTLRQFVQDIKTMRRMQQAYPPTA